MTDTCDVRHCSNPAGASYVMDDETYRICWPCWDRHCDPAIGFSLKAAGTLVLVTLTIVLLISRTLLEALL